MPSGKSQSIVAVRPTHDQLVEPEKSFEIKIKKVFSSTVGTAYKQYIFKSSKLCLSPHPPNLVLTRTSARFAACWFGLGVNTNTLELSRMDMNYIIVCFLERKFRTGCNKCDTGSWKLQEMGRKVLGDLSQMSKWYMTRGDHEFHLISLKSMSVLSHFSFWLQIRHEPMVLCLFSCERTLLPDLWHSVATFIAGCHVPCFGPESGNVGRWQSCPPGHLQR